MTKKVKDTCGKCDGKGKIRGFDHIEHGVCFACGGQGTVWVEAYDKSNSAKAVDSDLESRRSAFFHKMTLEQFKALPAEKRNAIAKWVENQYFEDRSIYYRFMEVFQPTWLAMSN